MIVNVNGIETSYVVEGYGDKVILILPGWTATSNIYTLITKQLSDDYRVYTLDLPGFGITPEPAQAWSIDDYADFVSEFIRVLGITDLTLLGHSFGGRIIIKLCNRENPFNINKVVLVDSAGIKNPLSKEQLKRQNQFKKLKNFYQQKPLNKLFPNAISKLQKKYGSSDYAAASPIMRNVLVMAVSEDYRSLISNIKEETLIIWGRNDSSTPISDALTMKKLIKNSTLEIIENADHFPFIDQPFAFRNILKKHFISSK